MRAALTLFWACASLQLSAQINSSLEFGAGLATQHFEPVFPYTHVNTANIASYHAGARISTMLNKRWTLFVGMDISRKGSIRDFSYFYNDSFHEAVHQKLAAAYLQLPVGLQLNIKIKTDQYLNIALGAAPGYLVAGRNLLDVVGADSATAYTYHSVTAMKSNNPLAAFDVSLLCSLGYQSAQGWYMSACYMPGVNDVGLGTEVDKNRVFWLSFGYLFSRLRTEENRANDLIDRSPLPDEKEMK